MLCPREAKRRPSATGFKVVRIDLAAPSATWLRVCTVTVNSEERQRPGVRVTGAAGGARTRKSV